jgi:hypothetical protein
MTVPILYVKTEILRKAREVYIDAPAGCIFGGE